jgi:hypothetical protein
MTEPFLSALESFFVDKKLKGSLLIVGFAFFEMKLYVVVKLILKSRLLSIGSAHCFYSFVLTKGSNFTVLLPDLP